MPYGTVTDFLCEHPDEDRLRLVSPIIDNTMTCTEFPLIYVDYACSGGLAVYPFYEFGPR